MAQDGATLSIIRVEGGPGGQLLAGGQVTSKVEVRSHARPATSGAAEAFQKGTGSADEQALIASARAGNPSAFNRLVSAYQDIVYNVAYRILAHPEAAADAVQEAFLAAYRALPAFRGGSFRAWLLRIATNACYSQLRLRKCRPQTSLEALAESPDWSPWLVDRGESPEEAALRDDLAAAIEAAISRLPWDQRVVVVLSDVEGLSYEEIIEATGASRGTVKSRLSRARARLRGYLAAAREPGTVSGPESSSW